MIPAFELAEYLRQIQERDSNAAKTQLTRKTQKPRQPNQVEQTGGR